MKQINQPQGSSLCGQCVVAMIADVSLDDAVAVMGSGRNYPRDVQNGLKNFGLRFEGKHGNGIGDGMSMPEVPCAVFAFIQNGEKHASHWVAWDGSQFIDPRGQVMQKLPPDWKASYYKVVKVAA